ncbi:MAG: helical backbone metal receptor [Proteobacteria bacterium]|nr:helical backbone metal receptor [Pseudomonadota bacterium]
MAAQRLTGALLLALLPLVAGAQQAVIAEDDEGHLVTLRQPARRVVSLAPQVTELLYAAGAGRRIVGSVALADHPPEAASLPKVGDSGALNLKAIAALKPDLIVAWPQGHTAAQWRRLQRLGKPIYVYRDPTDWARVGQTLRQFGALLGSDKAAQAAAADYEGRLRALTLKSRERTPLAVFVQLWPEPLTTVNGEHPASGALALCGARNALADLPTRVAPIKPAAVLAARPEAMVLPEVAGAPPEQLTQALAIWKDERAFELVSQQAVVPVAADMLTTPTPRALSGVEGLCEDLDRIRQARTGLRQP